MFFRTQEFPENLQLLTASGKNEFKLIHDKQKLSGLNSKAIYEDQKGNRYIAKAEKNRSYNDIFPWPTASPYLYRINDKKEFLIDEEQSAPLYKKHKDTLQDLNSCISEIASNIAGNIFQNFLRVPENYLCRLEDGRAVILSKLIPLNEKFNEFLKETNPIKKLNPSNPSDWKKCESLPKRAELNLDPSQANLIGKLYFIALLMGHWDIFNNINLTNSGSVLTSDGSLQPAIVDWGNCLRVGFGGVSADRNAFNNPQFPGLKLPADDPLNGFQGAVPFDKIVYPILPRQLVPDLFNLSGQDSTSKHMLRGFIQAYNQAKKTLYESTIQESIESTFENFVDANQIDYFKDILKSEDINAKTIFETLKGRIASLQEITVRINKGESMDIIAHDQFKKIRVSQTCGIQSRL